MKPRLLVFASGTATGGGSGFEKLVEASRTGVLEADVVGVVSNIKDGGVRERAERLGVKFHHFAAPFLAREYQHITKSFSADYFALSGWLKYVCGLDDRTAFNNRTVFNIHPGPLPKFGGPGMYGHHVHEAVMAAYKRGEIRQSAVSMHFVTYQYDKGPVFLNVLVDIMEGDTPETLGARVNAAEHRWQPYITNMVVQGKISWDGYDPATLVRPDYEIV